MRGERNRLNFYLAEPVLAQVQMGPLCLLRQLQAKSL